MVPLEFGGIKVVLCCKHSRWNLWDELPVVRAKLTGHDEEGHEKMQRRERRLIVDPEP